MFAEMPIYFRFGDFWANSIYSIYREGHAEFFYESLMHMHDYKCFACVCTVQAMTKMNVKNVKRFLKSAVADMRENNRKEIKCPCRK